MVRSNVDLELMCGKKSPLIGAAALTFDSNGNLTTDELGRTYKYDAWNRLVEVKSAGGAVLAKYGYDSLGRRITEGSGANARSLFYSSQWQVLEERVYGQAQFQYVWSPVYVDALVLRDRFLVAIPFAHLDAWTIQMLTAQSPVENWDAEALDAYYTLTTDVTPIQRKERLYVQQDAN